MPNPVPYQQLFDIDGLKQAIKDAETASDEFSSSVTQDFQRTQGAAAALKKELAEINALMNGKTIKLTDDSGQQQIVQYATEVTKLTTQIKSQQKQIESMTASLTQNKQVISDAKVAQAQYSAELAKGKADQQATRLEIANTTLELKKLALANKEAAAAARERNAVKTQFSDSNAEVQAYAASVNNSGGNVASSGKSALLKAWKADLDAGVISLEEYNLNLKYASERETEFAAQTIKGSVAIEEQVGILNGLKIILSELKAANPAIIDPVMLAKSNAQIQELEAEIARMGNMGKVGFDGMGNAVKNTVEKTGKFEAAIGRATNLSNIGARAVQMLTRQIIGLGVGMLSFVIGAKAIEWVTKWIEGLRIFNPLADEAALKIKDMNAALASSDYTKAIDNIQTLTEDIKLAKEGFLYKTEVLKEYNNKLGATLGYTDDLDKAEQLMVQHGEAYLQMMLLKAAGQIALAEASKKAYEAQQIANTPTNQFGDLVSFGAGNSSAPGSVPGEDAVTLMNRRRAAEQANKDQKIKDANDQKDKQLNIFRDFRQQAAKIAKENHIDFFDGKDPSKGVDDAQLTSIEQIKARIAELSKLQGSAVQGNPIEVRIEALKSRLKELAKSTKAAKDGFAELEDRANKMLLKLQDSIIRDFADNQGKATARTLELAAAYEKLVEVINRAKAAQADDINEVNRQNQIKKYGVVYPTAKVPNGPPTLSQKDQNILSIADNNSSIEKDEQALNDLVIKYNNANEAIIELYKKRTLTKEQLDERLTVSARFQADEEYQINLDVLNKQLENAKFIYGEDSKQYSVLLKQKSNLTKAFLDGNFKFLEEELAKEKKKLEDAYNSIFETVEKGAQMAGEATGNRGISSILGDVGRDIKAISLSHQPGEEAVTDAQKFQMAAQLGIDATEVYTDFAIKASERRQAALEREMQYEIEGAGNNKEAKLRIEAEYNKRIRDEKRKQAELQKAASAIEIIINTATAVSKTLASGGAWAIPLSVAVGALGAIELGIVLAQPIPQFAKGREDGPATYAEVNERGPEALVKGDRVRFANKGKRGLTFLERNEKVIPADQTAQLLNRQIAYANDSADNVSQSRLIYDKYVLATTTLQGGIDYNKLSESVKDAISRIPFEQNIMDEHGFARYVITKGAKIKAVRDRNKL